MEDYAEDIRAYYSIAKALKEEEEECVFSVIDVFSIEVPMFLLTLVKIGQIVLK